MRSGCPQTHQGGVYPVCSQHRSTSGIVTSSHLNNATPETMAYPACEIRPTMFASQHPGQHGPVHTPAQWQQLFGQAPQTVPAVYLRQDPQTSSLGTGFQYTVPMEDMFTRQSSCHQMSREANEESISSAFVSAQYSRLFVTTTNEYFARQPVVPLSGPSRECSNEHFIVHSWDGSNMNNNTRLAQTQDTRSCLNPALLKYSSTAVLQGVNLNMGAETLDVQDQPFVPSRHPLLKSLLTDTPTDCNSSVVTGLQTRISSSVSEDDDLNTILNTKTNLPDLTNYESQQAGPLPPALNYRQPRANMLPQDRTHIKYCTKIVQKLQRRGSHPTSYDQHSSSLSCQPSTEEVSARGQNKILTDGQIQDFIAARLAYFRSILGQNNKSNGQPVPEEAQTLSSSEEDTTLYPQNQSDSRSIMPKADNVAPPPKTFDPLVETQGNSDTGETKSQYFSCTVSERSFTADGEGSEEDGSKESKATALTRLAKKDDRAKAIPEKHSTGTPVIHENESVDKSASLNLPVKKQLDVTESEDSDGILIYSSDTSEDKTCVISNGESFNCKWFEKTRKHGLSTVPVLHYTLIALKELVASLENVETIAEMDNISDIVVQQYWKGNKDNIHVFTSTEYPQIMKTVAATCTKNEESLQILSAVSGMTLDELIEKHPFLTVNCNSSPEEYKSVWLNINKNLDEIDQEHGVSWAQQYTPKKEEARSLKPEAVDLETADPLRHQSHLAQTKSSSSENKTFELSFHTEKQDGKPGKTKNVQDPQHGSMTSKQGPQHNKAVPHSKLNLPHSENQIHNPASVFANQGEAQCNQTKINDTQFGAVMEDEDLVYSQTELNTTLSEHKEQARSRNEGEGSSILKGLQYEDITDEDSPSASVTMDSQLTTQLSVNKDDVSSLPVCFKGPLYEDITEDENSQNEDVNVQPQLFTLMSNHSDKSTPGNEGHGQGHFLHLAEMKTEVISDGELSPNKQVLQGTEKHGLAQMCCCPYFVETEDGFENQLCPKCETERDQNEDLTADEDFQCEEQTEDEGDEDHWMAIPIAISHLTFEPTDENQGSPKKLGENGDGGRTLTNPELHSSSSKPAPASTSSNMEVFETFNNFVQAKAVQLRNGFDCMVSTGAHHIHSVDQVTMTTSSDRSTPSREVESAREPYTPQSSRRSSTCETEDSSDYSTSPPERNYLTVSRQCWDKRPRPNIIQRSTSLSSSDSEREVCDNSVLSESESDYNGCTHVQQSQKGKIFTSEMEDSSDKSGCMRKSKELCKSKVGSERLQRKTKRQKISKRKCSAIYESDSEVESDRNVKRKAKRKHSEVLQHQSMDREGAISTPNLVVTGLVVQLSSDPIDCLKLSKESMVHEQREDGTQVPKAPVETSKNNDSSHKKRIRDKKGRFLSRKAEKYSRGHQKTKTSESETQATITEHASNSRKHSRQEGPSTSRHSSASARECLSQSREGSASSRKCRSYSKDGLRISREGSASSREFRSYSKEGLRLSREGSASSRECRSYSKDGLRISREGSASSREFRSNSKDGLRLSREGSASSRDCRSYSKDGLRISREALSSHGVHLSNYNGSPSKSGERPSASRKDPSTSTITSARQQVHNDWQNSYLPTRKDRKASLGPQEDLSPTRSNTAGREHYDAGREVRLGPSHYDRPARQRHNSHELVKPLMKRSMVQAMLWTNARHRKTPHEQRRFVGEGYKWAEKRTKGSSREVIKYRSSWPYQ